MTDKKYCSILQMDVELFPISHTITNLVNFSILPKSTMLISLNPISNVEQDTMRNNGQKLIAQYLTVIIPVHFLMVILIEY